MVFVFFTKGRAISALIYGRQTTFSARRRVRKVIVFPQPPMPEDVQELDEADPDESDRLTKA